MRAETVFIRLMDSAVPRIVPSADPCGLPSLALGDIMFHPSTPESVESFTRAAQALLHATPGANVETRYVEIHGTEEVTVTHSAVDGSPMLHVGHTHIGFRDPAALEHFIAAVSELDAKATRSTVKCGDAS